MYGISIRNPARLTALLTTLYALALLGIVVAQVSETQIRRFGPVGHSLSGSDLTQIVRLAITAGKPPWLLRDDTERFGVTVIRKDGQWVVTKWNRSVA
jgi:hypothetical protein